MNPKMIMDGVGLVVQLGLAVYQAIEAGDDSKTVGEIFAGVKKDREVLAELRKEAEAKFGE